MQKFDPEMNVYTVVADDPRVSVLKEKHVRFGYVFPRDEYETDASILEDGSTDIEGVEIAVIIES